MGILTCDTTGECVALSTRSLIGRSALAQLPLDEAKVSGEHASLYFIDGIWKIRDLASRNGTFLNGRKLAAGSPCPLSVGDQVAFGDPALTYTLEESGPPGPSAVHSNGTWVHAGDGALWLPSEQEPAVCITFEEGAWTLESEDDNRAVAHGEKLAVGDETWTLHLPHDASTPRGTTHQSTQNERSAEGLSLQFTVSADEEHVELRVQSGSQVFDLGSRSHNYTLLLMARRRREEAASGTSDLEAGWMYPDELMDMLDIDREKLNLQIFRARQAFKKASLPSEWVVERRADSRQMRIAASQFVIN